MKGFIRKKKRISQKNASRLHFNLFIKTVVYILLFIVIPTIFLGLCLKFFNFRKLFVQLILFFVFLLTKGYIFLCCLKLTNKWYLISDALFIVVFAGLYRFVEHCNGNFILLFFTVYVTCTHFFFMVRNIRQEGLILLQEDALSSKRIMNLIDVVKPIDVYIRNGIQVADNPQTDYNIDIELLTNRFFNSIDNKEFPITSNEIIKIYQELNINIFKQRRYNKSEFLNILTVLDLIKSDAEYNNLKRRKDSLLKDYSLGGNLKKLLQVIAVLKGIDCSSTCAKDIYDYWITTESSLN